MAIGLRPLMTSSLSLLMSKTLSAWKGVRIFVFVVVVVVVVMASSLLSLFLFLYSIASVIDTFDKSKSSLMAIEFIALISQK